MEESPKVFVKYLQRWWETQSEVLIPSFAHVGYERRRLGTRSAEELAKEFRSDVQFHVAQAAFFLTQPDVQLITRIVEELAPPPEGEELQILIDAMMLAGGSTRKVRAGAFAGLCVSGLMLLKARGDASAA